MPTNSNLGQGSTVPLRLLIAENCFEEIELAVTVLKRAGYTLTFDKFASADALEARVRQSHYDIVLLNVELFQSAPSELLQIVQRTANNPPIIILDPSVPEDCDFQMGCGADRVLKSTIARLPLAVQQVLQFGCAPAQREPARTGDHSVDDNWELIFDAIPDPILLLDASCRVTRVNRAVREMLEVGASEIIGGSCHDVLHGTVGRPANCPHELLIASGIAQRAILTESRLGKTLDVSSSPIVSPDGSFLGCVHMLRDVTDRIRTEQALKLSEQKFEGVFRSSPDAITLTSLHAGEFIDVNDCFEQLTGYTRSEVIGHKSLELGLWVDERERDQLVDAVSSKGRLRQFERRLHVKSGQIRTVTVSAELIRWAGQDCLVAVLHDVTDQKLADAALRRQALTFATLYDAVMIVDKGGHIVDWNPAATRLFRYEKDEVIGRKPYFLHRQDYATIEIGSLRTALKGSGRWEGELVLLRKDATECIVETVVSSLRDDTGEHIGYIAVNRDITERKRVEQAHRDSEHQLRLLLNSTAEAIYGLDESGRCTFCNPSAIRMLGYKDSGELLGKDMHDLIHHSRSDNSRFPKEQCGIYRAQTVGAHTHCVEDVLWRADGSSFPAEYWSYPIYKEEALVGSVVTFLDISERRRTEEALRQSEEKYREFMENAKHGIFQSSPDGQLLYVNPALVSLLGYASKEELQSRNLATDIYETANDRLTVLDSYRSDDRLDGVEINWKRKDGRVVVVRSSGRRMRSKDGRVSHYDSIVEDVTERRSLEDQLRQAQKIEAVGRLAGGIAHDFNNILGVILGYADLLLEQFDDAQTEYHRLLAIKNAATRAASLTRQLLAFSRKQVLEVRVIDLNTTVTETARMLLRLLGEDIQLKTKLTTEPAVTKADPTQIEQVIMNLAVNSRDAMPTGGTLMIETVRVAVTEGYADHHVPISPGQYVMLEISDTGEGMSEEVKKRIFEPYFTTKGKDKGTGLGLATVYGIVKQSGGFIWVYSELGHGTTFKIYLPEVCEPVEHIEKPMTLPPMPGGSETILLVEDSDALRELNHELLQNMGYTILEAQDGRSAISVAERHAGPIHLLLTDVVMPGMSGKALAEELTHSWPAIKVLYVSGYTDNIVLEQTLIDPGVSYLQKPCTRDMLARKVRDVLSAPASH